MGATISNARSRLYDRMATDSFCANDANKDFFDEDK
jgi:hypothetical protein